jgi:predicted ATPase/class 3 adenylate cyclase
MPCPRCQYESIPDAKFCDECGTLLAGPCPACGTRNRSGAKFCKACGIPLTAQTVPPQPEAESRFHAVLPEVMRLLQRERRVTYRTLEYVFGINETLLEEIREDLSFRQLAIDEDGKGLVWTGERQPTVQPAIPSPRPPTTSDTTAAASSPTPPALSPPITEPHTASHGPTGPAETIATEALQDAPVAQERTRTAPEAERRQLTVMFCDLADSTQLSQQLDPEDLREVVRAYQATAAEVIEQYEGHMAQYLGDGLLMYFGWPMAHEDDAQRAAYAGLGIVEAITTTLNPRLEREKGVQLTVRLGIHTGPVVVGEMGGGERHENLATGETVNIAARLEGLAAPNTVVISNVTARLVERAFALKDLGPHALKGVAESMPVFQVRGPLEAHEDERGAAGLPFLVGRDEELGLLARRWEQSKAGLGQVVLVSGTAGIGKSSLVEVLRAQVRDEGLPHITLRCSSYHTNSALYPVITHVERLLGLQREDVPATKLDKLAQGLRRYSQPLAEVVPLFASLLSVPLDDRYAAPTLTPPQQKQHTLDALVAWMLEEGERQPVLVTWEDLHWADPSTLELLGLVLEQTPTVPMLHVLTYRPEFELPWPTRSHMTPITLNRLERPQVEALITRLTRGKALPVEVVEHIVTKTDGVPLYVEELTKMLLESDLLRVETDQYVLTGPLLSVAIPNTLQDSLMARLDQMQTAKEVAQLGAVLGREFPYSLIQAISSQDKETIEAGLAQLVQAELLYQRGRPPRARYIFKHALIQDAAYASLLRSRRQHIHQRIAQQLEQRFPETVQMQPELVAHHYTEARCPEQAIAHWRRAGEQALQHSANQEAIGHLTTGLTLLATLPDTPARVQLELDMQMTRGPALMAVKGQAAPEVEQTYTRARELCRQMAGTPQLFPVLWGLWRFYINRGAMHTAHELSEQLLTLARDQQDTSFLLAAHQALGATLYIIGEYTRARMHLEQGIALEDTEPQRALAIRYGVSPTVYCLGMATRPLWVLGYPDQALQRGHEASTLAHELAHPPSTAFTLYHVANFHMYVHQVDRVREQAHALITLAAEHELPHWKSVGMFLQGWALVAQEQCEEGLVHMRQGMTDVLTMGAEVYRLTFLLSLAESHSTGGQVAEGLQTLAEARTVLEATGQRYYEAELYRLMGALRLQQAAQDAPQAEACFQQALAIARRQEAKSLELRAATSLARLWQSQGKRQEAHDLLALVYGWFTEGFDTADLLEAKALLHELDA